MPTGRTRGATAGALRRGLTFWRRSLRARVVLSTVVLSALVLFGVGVYTAVTLTGDWRKSGLTFLVIGLGAAGIGFVIGNLFHSTGA